jgi:hypothetical protein
MSSVWARTTLPVRLARRHTAHVTPEGLRAWQAAIERRLAYVELVLLAEHPSYRPPERIRPDEYRDPPIGGVVDP